MGSTFGHRTACLAMDCYLRYPRRHASELRHYSTARPRRLFPDSGCRFGRSLWDSQLQEGGVSGSILTRPVFQRLPAAIDRSAHVDSVGVSLYVRKNSTTPQYLGELPPDLHHLCGLAASPGSRVANDLPLPDKSKTTHGRQSRLERRLAPGRSRPGRRPPASYPNSNSVRTPPPSAFSGSASPSEIRRIGPVCPLGSVSLSDVPTSTGYQNVTVAFDTRAAPFVSLKV